MQKLTAFFYDIFTQEKDNLWLWMPVLFGFGAAFYFLFEESFIEKFALLLVLFFISSFLAFLNRNSLRFLVFLGCALFLLGGFYSDFYQKTILNHTKISGKIYVDGIGKVESIRKFYNPKNGVEGSNLVISEPVLYKSKFAEKKKKVKKPHQKKVSKQIQEDAKIDVNSGANAAEGDAILIKSEKKKRRRRKSDEVEVNRLLKFEASFA